MSLLPLAMLDKAVGNHVLVLLRSEQEFHGVLQGFDDYMNLVLDETTEIVWRATGASKAQSLASPRRVLINSNNVVMIVPCAEIPPPDLFENIAAQKVK